MTAGFDHGFNPINPYYKNNFDDNFSHRSNRSFTRI